MKPPDLSRMPVFVLVARVKIGSLSLPFTGQPFVEALQPVGLSWALGCRCPSPGSPSLRLVRQEREVHPFLSLPFTGQPFVEAPRRGSHGRS